MAYSCGILYRYDRPAGESASPVLRQAWRPRRYAVGERPALGAAETACYSATPYSLSTSHTLSGVIGMSRCVTPRCASASTTAFAIAGGAPTVADSPTPFAPSGWCGDLVIVCPVSYAGVSMDVGTR